MALEIKELIVKITVGESNLLNTIQQQELSQNDKKEIVNECVEKVMEKLEFKFNR